MILVFISWGCYNKLPLTGWLKTTVVEAKSQIKVPARALGRTFPCLFSFWWLWASNSCIRIHMTFLSVFLIKTLVSGLKAYLNNLG